MTAAISRSRKALDPVGGGATLSVADLVLLRIGAGGASRADLQRDLACLVAPKTSGTVFRQMAELAIGNGATQQMFTESKGRLQASDAGLRAAQGVLAPTPRAITSWPDVRDHLVARAIGVSSSPAMLAALQRPESLAALVLQRHFKLPATKVLSPTDLRAELAVVALERAFGNKIKTGLGKGSGLPGKTGRLLAGQLFKLPREVATDGKLVLALAVEILGADEATVDALKLALLRRLTTPRDAIETIAKSDGSRTRAPTPKPDNDASPLRVRPSVESQPVVAPDLTEFCQAVFDAARPVAEGWPGNRKAFISLVWQAIRNARPDWALTEVAFKSMLAEAHRSGRVELAGADLKDKCDLKKLEESKILYKNTVWHFVRVED